MRRDKRYRRDIRQWDWEKIRAEALSNPNEQGEWEEEHYGSCFIGSVFTLTPSGKFYTPWATSNLTPCPQCKGEGRISNRKTGDADRYYPGKEELDATRVSYATLHGFASDWPEGLLEKTNTRARELETFNPVQECNWCGGIGSHEAAQDEDWREALEYVAGSKGMWLTNGEGDPCDLFICTPLEGK
jgi:hypothetical protein